MSISEEIFEEFFSTVTESNKVQKPIIEQLKSHYSKGEHPTEEVIIKSISGVTKDVLQS